MCRLHERTCAARVAGSLCVVKSSADTVAPRGQALVSDSSLLPGTTHNVDRFSDFIQHTNRALLLIHVGHGMLLSSVRVRVCSLVRVVSGASYHRRRNRYFQSAMQHQSLCSET